MRTPFLFVCLCVCNCIHVCFVRRILILFLFFILCILWEWKVKKKLHKQISLRELQLFYNNFVCLFNASYRFLRYLFSWCWAALDIYFLIEFWIYYDFYLKLKYYAIGQFIHFSRLSIRFLYFWLRICLADEKGAHVRSPTELGNNFYQTALLFGF